MAVFHALCVQNVKRHHHATGKHNRLTVGNTLQCGHALHQSSKLNFTIQKNTSLFYFVTLVISTCFDDRSTVYGTKLKENIA